MMLNKVELLGRIGYVRIQTVGGGRVANFSVCTEAAYTNRKGEPVLEQTWHNCTLWERWAGQLDDLERGLPVHVVGRIRTRSYEKGGDVRYANEVVVNELQITTPEAQLAPEQR